MQSSGNSTRPLLIIGAIGIAVSLLVSNFVQKRMDGALVAGGKAAPEFSLAGVDNRRVVLRDIVTQHKATLVNFWFVACPSCQAEFPYLQNAYKRFHGQGLEIVAINVNDDAATIRRFARDKKLSFRFALDDRRTANAYGVSGTPTNYLLDAKGRIVWRAEGFDGDGQQLAKALSNMGFH